MSENTTTSTEKLSQDNNAKNSNPIHENDDKESKKRIETEKISRLLKYAAGALSFISFITTSNGLVTVLGEEHSWQAYFISFGIQAVVLVLGMNFLEVITNVHKSEAVFLKLFEKRTNLFKRLFCVLMGVLYFLSIGFSSTFSFVFIANSAYDNVKASDYNIEIEQFLVTETRNLKEINNKAGLVVLSNIQSKAPEFSNMIEELSSSASVDIKDIIANNNLQKAENISSSLENIFDTNAVIGRVNANEDQISMVETYAKMFDTMRQNYNQSYSKYSNYFEELQQVTSIIMVQQRITDIDAEIATLNSYITEMEKMVDLHSEINALLVNARSATSSTFNSLISAYNNLKSVYQQIDRNDFFDASVTSLEAVYETIYSSNEITETEIDRAVSDLTEIIKYHIKNSDEINTKTIENISDCVIYLKEYKKHLRLEDMIEHFETDTLNKVYILLQPTTTEPETTEPPKEDTTDLNHEKETPEPTTIEPKTTAPSTTETTEPKTTETSVEPENSTDIAEEQLSGESSTESDTETTTELKIAFTEVYPEEWQKNRRKDMAEFIAMIKSMPDIELLINTMENSDTKQNNSVSVSAGELNKYADYVSDTLDEAYKLNRDKLENIHSVERAYKFLLSKYFFMALFSGAVAFFMDFAAFLIGMYIYISKNKNDKCKNAADSSSNETNNNSEKDQENNSNQVID